MIAVRIADTEVEMKKYKRKLSLIFLCILLCVSLVGCTDGQSKAAYTQIVLREGQDAGEEYIDSFIFLGESTTYHLKSRGVLKGGTKTTQVWSNKLGTINLDAGIASLKIVYPETGELLTLSEAVSRKQPLVWLCCKYCCSLIFAVSKFFNFRCQIYQSLSRIPFII